MKRSLTIPMIILTLALIQVACGMTNRSTGSISIEIATPTGESPAAVNAPANPAPTPTLPPPAGPTASPTLPQTAPTSGELVRLEFLPGTTSTVVTGNLAANESRGYLVTAQQGQVIIAGMPPMDSLSGMQVRITTSENVALPDMSNIDDYVASLPATQDYIVWVVAGDRSSDYHLAVTIPNRITFEPGAVSASIDETIRNYHSISYVLRASAGQTMSVSLHSANTILEIRGLDDHQLLLDPSSNATAWTGTLPATQDYIINVLPSVETTTFKLNVIIQ